MEAHFAIKGMTNWSFRSMPEMLYQQILVYWHLETVAEKAQSKAKK
jgi:hypothetical protein